MKYVLDASVAAKWVIAEADTPKALQLRDDFRSAVHELLAPDVFPIEIAHALTRAERQGRITAGDSGPLLMTLFQTLPAMHSSLSLLVRACEISSRMRIGVYDCLYLALAEREGCELVTADQRLATLKPQFPFIVDLADL